MKSSYDVIVIGAGINGVGIANALSQSRAKVLVIDKGEVGGGASSHSSRLIHGGLRYLENFHFALVKESLHDRNRLVSRYPDLVSLLPFYMPLYKTSPRPAWMIRTGLWLYDLLSGHFAPRHSVDREDFTQMFPAVKSEGLQKVFHYYDGKTNDLLLTQTIAAEAQKEGCDFLTNSKIESIAMDDNEITLVVDGSKVRTSKLVNATGAWIDEVNQAFGLPSNFTIRKVSGIHLVLEGLLTPHPLFLQAAQERMFFVIPETETNETIIGTTERTESLPCDAVSVNEEDIEYLIREINFYLKKPITKADVIGTYIGIRPLIESKKSESKSSREYKLDLHRRGKTRLLHIYGGKLTTFYALSQKAKKLLD